MGIMVNGRYIQRVALTGRGADGHGAHWTRKDITYLAEQVGIQISPAADHGIDCLVSSDKAIEKETHKVKVAMNHSIPICSYPDFIRALCDESVGKRDNNIAPIMQVVHGRLELPPSRGGSYRLVNGRYVSADETVEQSDKRSGRWTDRIKRLLDFDIL